MNRQLLITLMRIAFVVLFLALVETARAENPHSHPEQASQYANSAR